MTQTIPQLDWTPYQGGGTGTLIAQVILDSAIDTDWLVPMSGRYSNQSVVYADGVIIANEKNNGDVDVVAGPLFTTVAAFTRDFVLLDKNIGGNLAVRVPVGIVALLLYKGEPPINPSVINYAGAQAVNNSNLFRGGATTGTANAQAISVDTNYQFSNGVLISAVAGLTNTGALSLNVNGMGAIAVQKISAGGLVACTGGEFELGASFIVAVNAVAGVLVLVSRIYAQKSLVRFDGAGAIVSQSPNVSSVVKNSAGRFTVNFAPPLPANFVPMLSIEGNGTAILYYIGPAAATVNAIQVTSANLGGALTDASFYQLTVLTP